MTPVRAAKVVDGLDASERDWVALAVEVPQLAATMRRYLIQLGTFLAPRRVDMASHTLRQFAGWLVANTDRDAAMSLAASWSLRNLLRERNGGYRTCTHPGGGPCRAR